MQKNDYNNIQKLPMLDRKINLLNPDKQKKQALQSLIINHLIKNKGHTIWIDAHNYASTHIMHKLTPDPTLLERIQIARAFTPYQHYSLTENLIKQINQETSLVVAPAFDYLYGDETLYKREGKKMVSSAIEHIENITDQYNIPILLTDTGKYTSTIKNKVEETIECKITSMGARFQSSNFETLVYPTNGGLQTTLELWRLILKETYKSIDIKQKQHSEVETYG